MENIKQNTEKQKIAERIKSKIASDFREMKKSRYSYLLMAPYFTLFFAFTVLPVLISIYFSFTFYNILEPPKFIGWENYLNLFLDDDIFLIAIRNTFIFSAITGPLSYFLCFAFAWVINELPPKLRAIMVVIIYAPTLSGSMFFIWRVMFDGDSYGYVNGFLMRFGIINDPILWLQDPRYMLSIVIIVQLWLSLGTSFLVFIAGLQNVDRTLYESGAIDGVKNRWQEVWFITLPSMIPQLMFGAIMQITATLAVSQVATELAGFPSTDYAAHTIVTHLNDYGTFRFEMGYASAIATVLFVVMVGTNKIVQRLLRKIGV